MAKLLVEEPDALMRARPDLWEPWEGNDPGPPGPPALRDRVFDWGKACCAPLTIADEAPDMIFLVAAVFAVHVDLLHPERRQSAYDVSGPQSRSDCYLIAIRFSVVRR
jgi:hypothetical protein